jgi:hypothetical protein
MCREPTQNNLAADSEDGGASRDLAACAVERERVATFAKEWRLWSARLMVCPVLVSAPWRGSWAFWTLMTRGLSTGSGRHSHTRRWTCCLVMACKRGGAELAYLAPLGLTGALPSSSKLTSCSARRSVTGSPLTRTR